MESGQQIIIASRVGKTRLDVKKYYLTNDDELETFLEMLPIRD